MTVSTGENIGICHWQDDDKENCTFGTRTTEHVAGCRFKLENTAKHSTSSVDADPLLQYELKKAYHDMQAMYRGWFQEFFCEV